MVELTADRLMLVDGGTAKEYSGSMDDYIDFVMGRNQPKQPSGSGAAKPAPANPGKTRAKARFLKSELASAEKAMTKLEASLSQIDEAMCDPASAPAHLADIAMDDLLIRRAEVSERLAKAEAEWLALGEQIESLEDA